MALTVTVTPGHTFQDDVAWDNDDLNAAANPSIAIDGIVSSTDVQDGSITFEKTKPGPHFYETATTTFGAGVYAITLDPALAAYVAGAIIRWKVPSTNTTAVDVNVDGLGDKNLFKHYITTENTAQEMEAGDLRAGSIVEMIYDGTQWTLLSPLQRTIAELGVAGSAADAFVVDVPNPPYQLFAGFRVVFISDFTTTAAPTVEVNNVAASPNGAQAVKFQSGAAIGAGDISSGDVVDVVYDGTDWIFQGGGGTQSGLVFEGDRGRFSLQVKRASVSTVDIDADWLVLSTAGGTLRRVDAVDLTADIGASVGINGRDAGTEANDTFYYIWVISDGSTTASLLSTSDTAPTMPSGYTFKRLVGVVLNDSSGDFEDFRQRGNRVAIAEWGSFAIAVPGSLGSSWTEHDFTSGTLFLGDMDAVIPLQVTGLFGMLSVTPNGTSDDFYVNGAESDAGRAAVEHINPALTTPQLETFDPIWLDARSVWARRGSTSISAGVFTVSGYYMDI